MHHCETTSTPLEKMFSGLKMTPYWTLESTTRLAPKISKKGFNIHNVRPSLWREQFSLGHVIKMSECTVRLLLSPMESQIMVKNNAHGLFTHCIIRYWHIAILVSQLKHVTPSRKWFFAQVQSGRKNRKRENQHFKLFSVKLQYIMDFSIPGRWLWMYCILSIILFPQKRINTLAILYCICSCYSTKMN